MAASLGGVPITWDASLYLADVESIKAAASSDPANTCLLIGHNPGLESFALYCRPDIERRSKYLKIMPTAAIYAFRIEHIAGTLREGCGFLLGHQRPKALN
jgi:phosphohistidine phosphatase SixA